MREHTAIYNARNPEMQISYTCTCAHLLSRILADSQLSERARLLVGGLRHGQKPWSFRATAALVVMLLSLFVQVQASDWRSPESQLAARITAITGPGVVSLEVNNRSSIVQSDVENIRRDLSALFAASGIRIGNTDQALATITVTLSENLQNYVWISEIRQGINEPSIVMLSFPRPDSASLAQSATPLIIRATRLISQPGPILDVAVIAGDPRRLLALGDTAITSYEFRNNHWSAGQSFSFNSPGPLPRDRRGRVILHDGGNLFDVYLPGMACRNANSATLTINCSRSDDPWPLNAQDPSAFAFFAPTQNFFTGALVPGIGQQKSVPAFYSAAAIPRPNYTLWIFAGVDGQLHLLDGINHLTLSKVHWGSDIAAVHASCRAGWQVLATSTGSGPQDNNDKDKDWVQAFEFPDREPVPVSQKLEMNGKITALWPSPSGDTATAVIRNSETGEDEAVLLDISCGQ